MDNLILVIFPSHYVHIVLVTFLGFRPVAFCVVVLLDNHSVPNSNNNNNNNNNNRQKYTHNSTKAPDNGGEANYMQVRKKIK